MMTANDYARISQKIPCSINFLEGDKMSIFSKMMDDRKKTKAIEKKIKTIEHTRVYTQEADDLKTKFGLSDDEAVFMAKKNISKRKRSETIGKLSAGLGDVMDGLGELGGVAPAGQAPSRKTAPAAKKGKGGKKKKGKSKPKESKEDNSDPFGMPELDLPGFKF